MKMIKIIRILSVCMCSYNYSYSISFIDLITKEMTKGLILYHKNLLTKIIPGKINMIKFDDINDPKTILFGKITIGGFSSIRKER